jgi:hypothetical protein
MIDLRIFGEFRETRQAARLSKPFQHSYDLSQDFAVRHAHAR